MWKQLHQRKQLQSHYKISPYSLGCSAQGRGEMRGLFTAQNYTLTKAGTYIFRASASQSKGSWGRKAGPEEELMLWRNKTPSKLPCLP